MYIFGMSSKGKRKDKSYEGTVRELDLDPLSILEVFSSLDDVYMFMKDREGVFIGGNDLQLRKLGLKSREQLLGKTDFDFFPSLMIAHYAADDARVIDTESPVVGRVEAVANTDGSLSWHKTSKFPLYNRRRQCIGIIGFMRDYRGADPEQAYHTMHAVVSHIHKHYAENLTVGELAQLAGLSVSQFERRFRAVFHLTPAKFILRYRLTLASQALVRTNSTLTAIALELGFYDQSHFSREFRKFFGVAPGQYRQKHSG